MVRDLELAEVAADVFAVIGADGMANSGFVVGGDAVALIDAQASPRLGAELRRLVIAVTRVPVRYAVISHHHGDHLFGIQAWPDVRVLAHPGCGRALRDLAGSRPSTSDDRLDPATLLRVFVGALAAEQLERLPDHPIRRRLAGPDYDDVCLVLPDDLGIDRVGHEVALDLGGVSLSISHPGPAHGDDDLVVSVPGRGVVFLGDLGFIDRVPAVTSPYVPEWTVVTGRLAQRADNVVVPGHGPPALPAQLHTQLEYLTALLAEVNAATPVPPRLRALPGFDRWHALNRHAAASRRADPDG